MAATVRMDVKEVVRHFKQLEDPRSAVNRLHPLDSVVVIAIMAVLAGANGPTAIAKWANMKAEVLLKLLELPHGIPQKDVFRRVLVTLKPDAFQACFTMWLTALRTAAAEATGVERPTLAVDGKTLRRSHDRRRNLGALHSVSVWASEFGLTLAQVATAEKSNEITAILFGSIVAQGRRVGKQVRVRRRAGGQTIAVRWATKRRAGRMGAATNAVAVARTGDRALGVSVLFLQLGQVSQQLVLLRQTREVMADHLVGP